MSWSEAADVDPMALMAALAARERAASVGGYPGGLSAAVAALEASGGRDSVWAPAERGSAAMLSRHQLVALAQRRLGRGNDVREDQAAGSLLTSSATQLHQLLEQRLTHRRGPRAPAPSPSELDPNAAARQELLALTPELRAALLLRSQGAVAVGAQLPPARQPALALPGSVAGSREDGLMGAPRESRGAPPRRAPSVPEGSQQERVSPKDIPALAFKRPAAAAERMHIVSGLGAPQLPPPEMDGPAPQRPASSSASDRAPPGRYQSKGGRKLHSEQPAVSGTGEVEGSACEPPLSGISSSMVERGSRLMSYGSMQEPSMFSGDGASMDLTVSCSMGGASQMSCEDKQGRRLNANRDAARRMRKRFSQRVAELESQMSTLRRANSEAMQLLKAADARAKQLEEMNLKLEQQNSAIEASLGRGALVAKAATDSDIPTWPAAGSASDSGIPNRPEEGSASPSVEQAVGDDVVLVGKGSAKRLRGQGDVEGKASPFSGEGGATNKCQSTANGCSNLKEVRHQDGTPRDMTAAVKNKTHGSTNDGGGCLQGSDCSPHSDPSSSAPGEWDGMDAEAATDPPGAGAELASLPLDLLDDALWGMDVTALLSNLDDGEGLEMPSPHKP